MTYEEIEERFKSCNQLLDIITTAVALRAEGAAPSLVNKAQNARKRELTSGFKSTKHLTVEPIPVVNLEPALPVQVAVQFLDKPLMLVADEAVMI